MSREDAKMSGARRPQAEKLAKAATDKAYERIYECHLGLVSGEGKKARIHRRTCITVWFRQKSGCAASSQGFCTRDCRPCPPSVCMVSGDRRPFCLPSLGCSGRQIHGSIAIPGH